jgi:hypothetical protein
VVARERASSARTGGASAARCCAQAVLAELLVPQYKTSHHIALYTTTLPVFLFWDPKVFPLGSQIQRLWGPNERKHSNDARGLVVLLID